MLEVMREKYRAVGVEGCLCLVRLRGYLSFYNEPRYILRSFVGTDKGRPTKLKNPMILGVESDQLGLN